MRINVDAGHGSNTAGKRTPPMQADIDINKDGKTDLKKGEQYREHYANVEIASLLVKELQRCGFDTMQTGFNDNDPADDTDTTLCKRQAVIAKANCDYSISIHFNAYGDGQSFNNAQGVGIYIHDKYAGQSQKMADIIIKHLSGGSKQINRGVSKQSFAMCNCNAMDTKAAILIELAFMTNEHEATTMMANEAYWIESVQEICKGVCEYTGVKYVAEFYIPDKTITPESDPEDIIWAQRRYNVVLPNIPGLIPLKTDGIYGPDTRLATLLYWRQLGLGNGMKDDGTRIGKATKEALAKGRVK